MNREKANAQKVGDLPRAKSGFSVPGNSFGFCVHHTKSNRPMPHNQLTALYKHVLGPVHKKVLAELREDIKAEQV